MSIPFLGGRGGRNGKNANDSYAIILSGGAITRIEEHEDGVYSVYFSVGNCGEYVISFNTCAEIIATPQENISFFVNESTYLSNSVLFF